MAIKLSSHKCTDCSGKLEFNKEFKRFECPYCGKVYEKDFDLEKGQSDGLATTNDVIRVILLNLASNEMDDAKRNLMECEKLNHNYIGTKIANLCYYRFLSFNSSGQEANTSVAKLKYYYDEIRKEANIDESERGMYDSFAQPDSYAVVYIALISVNLRERASYVANFLDFNRVVNPVLNKYMLKITLQVNAIKEADQILENVDFIDKKQSIFQMLKYYPDSPKKQEHIVRLFKAKALTYQDDQIVKNYLAETKDGALTKITVVIEAMKIRMQISMTEVLKNLLARTNDESVEQVFENLSQIKLSDQDTALVLEFILGSNCNSKKAITLGLKSLKDNGSLYEIPARYVIMLIDKKGLQALDKVEIIDFVYDNFRMTTKSYEAVLNHALTIYDNKEQRISVLECVLKHSTDISFTTLTDYLYTSKIDGENKPRILEKIFELNISKVYFQDLLTNYVAKSNDSRNTIFAVAKTIAQYDKKLTGQGAIKMILNIESEDDAFFIFNLNVNIPSTALDEYIGAKNTYNDLVISKLAEAHCNISEATLRRYLISGRSQAKADIAALLISRTRSVNTKATYSCNYKGESITCNLVQYYLFTSVDSAATKLQIARNLIGLKIKLSDNMIVNQKKIAFKKYILGLKGNGSLDADIDNICNELSVYKMFF